MKSHATCGCCAGIAKVTPVAEANRPGLNSLVYRAGTHATFFETMQARLSNLAIQVPTGQFDAQGNAVLAPVYPLKGLTTRDPGDPAIALLDAWATVADVLTFYQERIANEGYLRTATERESVLELGRLVGYTLRPGVSASVFLAFTIDSDRSVTPPISLEATVPAGTRAQSMPDPGQMPQPFETGADLAARTEWNTLQVRLSRPQTQASILANPDAPVVFLQGTSTNLKTNDPILIDFEDGSPRPYRVVATVADSTANRTQVTLRPWTTSVAAAAKKMAEHSSAASVGQSTLERQGDPGAAFFSGLKLPPSVPPHDVTALGQSLKTAFSPGADVFPRLLTQLQPAYDNILLPALQNASVAPAAPITLYALRVSASLFGHNGTQTLTAERDGDGTRLAEGPVPSLSSAWGDLVPENAFPAGFPTIALDSNYEQIPVGPQSWIVIDRPGFAASKKTEYAPQVSIVSVQSVRGVTMSAFGISLKVSQLSLADPWFSQATAAEIRAAIASTPLLRGTSVYAQSDNLPLAEESIPDPVGGDQIELDGLYDNLQAGRWLIFSGERTDVLDANGNVVTGIQQAELVMLLSATQTVQQTSAPDSASQGQAPLAGDKTHTFLQLSKPLAYQYKRATLTIYGNVAKATHGQTWQETLGSGDASQAFLTLPLRQSPLTYLAAAAPAGAASTLTLRVNQVQWSETGTLLGLKPADRKFVTQTDNNARTTVTFGNGAQGARPPTGTENITATYRVGIGSPGNVDAGKISLLSTRPLNVTGVINPLPSTGGADGEDIAQARGNVPVALQALDRLVSIQDYADFSRTFAGIGKANSARLSDGARLVVYVTMAGADDIPIDVTSDLYQNLLAALQLHGDPYLPVQVAWREMLALVVSAGVRVLPDYAWEFVEPAIRAKLLDTFSFQRRCLGQDVTQGEVISTIQKVPGVAYVDLQYFFGVPAASIEAELSKTTIAPDGNAGAGTAALPQFFLDLLGQARHASLVPRIVAQPARTNPNPTSAADLILPAQMITIQADAPESLILMEITS